MVVLIDELHLILLKSKQWYRVSDILSNMSKKKRKCLKASVHGYTGIFTLRLKVTVLERMKSETLVIFIIIIIISSSWELCSSCWGSSSGSWTWSRVSVDCHHYAPDPPLHDKPHGETHKTPQTYMLHSIISVVWYSQKHRKSVSTPMLYTLKKPWAIRYAPNTTVCHTDR